MIVRAIEPRGPVRGISRRAGRAQRDAVHVAAAQAVARRIRSHQPGGFIHAVIRNRRIRVHQVGVSTAEAFRRTRPDNANTCVRRRDADVRGQLIVAAIDVDDVAWLKVVGAEHGVDGLHRVIRRGARVCVVTGVGGEEIILQERVVHEVNGAIHADGEEVIRRVAQPGIQ